MYRDRDEYGHVHVQGHAQIWAFPYTWTRSNMALSMYRYGPEFGLVPIHGQGHILVDVGAEGGWTLVLWAFSLE